jgi:hypothetical protein
MRLRIATFTKLGSIPVGIAVGFWMTLLTEPTCVTFADPRGGGTACPYVAGQALTQPRFAWWMCALIGAATAVGLLAISRLVRKPPSSHVRWMVASILRVLAPAAGVGVGIAMAQFVSFCDLRALRLITGPHVCAWQTTFPLWALILFGAAAAAVVLLVAQAVEPHRPRTPRSPSPRAAVPLGR